MTAPRMKTGLRHEQEAAEKLREHDWHVEPFGQGQLSEDARRALRPFPTALRWLPDQLIWRSGFRPLLCDPKAGRTDTRNFNIEQAALRAHVDIEETLGIGVVYICADFTWTTPALIEQSDWRLGPTSPNGSGTPYLLYPREGCCLPLSQLTDYVMEQAA